MGGGARRPGGRCGRDTGAPRAADVGPGDYAVCKGRHPVECFVGKHKHFRRVFARFDKYAKRFLAFARFVRSATRLR